MSEEQVPSPEERLAWVEARVARLEAADVKGEAFSLRRAANYIGVSERTLRNMLYTDGHPIREHAYKMGEAKSSPWRFRREGLDEWMEAQKT